MDIGLAVLGGRPMWGRHSADCRIAGLYFLPLRRERYDLLILKERFFDPTVQDFLSLLHAKTFHDMAAVYQGYDLASCGKMVFPPNAKKQKTIKLDGGMMKKRAKWGFVGGLLCLAAMVAFPCGAMAKTLMMATTTSTDNTGLLDYLAPAFTKSTGIELKWTAVGTGKALKLGENCDVDVLMVHAPGAEKNYVAAGFGIDRREVMFNDFVLIGPPADPAGIKGASVTGALKAIAAKSAVFVSRGDNSAPIKKRYRFGRPPVRAFPKNKAGTCRPVRACWPPSTSPPRRTATP